MAKIIQNSFSSGEISPVLHARSDLASYYKAVASSENFTVTREGTLRKRNGFTSVAELPKTGDICPVWTDFYYDGNYSSSYGYCLSALCAIDKICTVDIETGALKRTATITGDWETCCANSSGAVMAISSDGLSYAYSADGGTTYTTGTTTELAISRVGKIASIGPFFVFEALVENEGVTTLFHFYAQPSGSTVTWTGVQFLRAEEPVTTLATRRECVDVNGATPGKAVVFYHSDGNCISTYATPSTPGPSVLKINDVASDPAASYIRNVIQTSQAVGTPEEGEAQEYLTYACLSDASVSKISSTFDETNGFTLNTTSPSTVNLNDRYDAMLRRGSYLVLVKNGAYTVLNASTLRTVRTMKTDVSADAWMACYANKTCFIGFKGTKYIIGRVNSNGTATFYQYGEEPITVKANRIIPYRYSRTEGGYVHIFTNRAYFFDKSGAIHDFPGAEHDAQNRAYITIPLDIASNNAIQYKQVGDQLWISNGEACCTITVTNNESISISTWKNATKPAKIPYLTSVTQATSFNVTVSGESSIEEYKTVTYACCGTKDSVHSSMTQIGAQLPLTWEAGVTATISVTVTAADIDNYDSITVGKRSGSSIGILAEFYTDGTDGTAFSTSGAQCYRHDDDGQWYTAETGGTLTTLAYIRFVFVDENHVPTDIVYNQTNVLGAAFANPLCVDCYQQRRVFANASNAEGTYPMTLWFSEVGNIDCFHANRPTQAGDAFSPTISSTGPAYIQFVMNFRESLVLFTKTGIFTVGFSQTSGGFSSSTCRISKISDVISCDDIHPVMTENDLFFVAADKKNVFSLSAVQNGGVAAVNRSILVEDLTRTDELVSMAYQPFPDNILWFSTRSGKLLTLTHNADENVLAWSHSSITGATVKEITCTGTCTDSTTARTYSDIHAIVEKSGRQYLCVATLEHADKINSVETPVTAAVTLLRPESREESLIGNSKNIKDLIVRVYESGPFKVVPSNTNGTVQAVRSTNPANFSGDVKLMPRGYVSEDGQMTFVSDDASPLEILSVSTELEVR